MRFLTEILIFQWTGIVIISLSETAITEPPKPLKVKAGETLNFTWTSDVPKISLAIWGVGSGALPSPQYIYVDARENPTINTRALDDDLVRRLKYIGNLAQGRAWFVIYNATVNDSNTYTANIQEEGSSAISYYVNVIVEPTTVATTASTTTIPPSINIKTSSSTPTPTLPTNASITTVPPTTAKGLSVGAIIGIAIGSVVGVICIIIIVVVLCKRYNKKREQDNLPADKKEDTEMNSRPAVNA